MSYEMAFKGNLHYRSARDAKQAVARFERDARAEDGVLSTDDVTRQGRYVAVECFTSAPASMWEGACSLIETLAERATGGHVQAQYDPGEGEHAILRLRYLPGGDEEELEGPFPDGMEPSRTAAVDEEPNDGGIVLAALKGDADKVRALLQRGVPPERALHGAVRNPAILRILLEHGLEAKGDPSRQASPLCSAARGGCAEAIRMLVAAGAGLEETDTSSAATPLMLATEQLHQEAVEALLALGADPRAVDAKGNTPLHYAVWLGNPESVEVAAALHAGGANPDARNHAGETMWDRAAPMPYHAELLRRLGRG